MITTEGMNLKHKNRNVQQFTQRLEVDLPFILTQVLVCKFEPKLYMRRIFKHTCF